MEHADHVASCRYLVEHKNVTYWETRYVPPANPDTMPGSRFVVFVNGQCAGIAARDLTSGVGYFPAVSLYKNGSVRVNFGPDFKFPPPSSPFLVDGELLPPPLPMQATVLGETVRRSVSDLVYRIEELEKLQRPPEATVVAAGRS